VWFYVEDGGRIVFYEKDGENAGVSGLIRHYPAQDLSLVLLCNMRTAAWDPAWEVHVMLVAGEFEDQASSKTLQSAPLK
jgi:hypothetical protein